MLWIAAGTFCILDCLPVALPLPLYVGLRHTTLLIHCTLLHSTLAIPWGALLDLFAVGLPPPPLPFHKLHLFSIRPHIRLLDSGRPGTPPATKWPDQLNYT